MQYFTQLMSTELAVGNRAISFEASFPMSNAHFLGRVYQELLDPPSPLPFSLRDARAQPHLMSHCIPDSPYYFISSCLCIAFFLCLEYSLLTFPSGLGNASPSCKTQFNCQLLYEGFHETLSPSFWPWSSCSLHSYFFQCLMVEGQSLLLGDCQVLKSRIILHSSLRPTCLAQVLDMWLSTQLRVVYGMEGAEPYTCPSLTGEVKLTWKGQQYISCML